MKLYIERNGSGWGGYYGQYLIDLETNKYIKINNPEKQGSFSWNTPEKTEWLKSLNNSECMSEIHGDCSLLKMLKNTELKDTSVTLDGQADQVFVIDNDFVQLVYAPEGIPFITPCNQALVAKIRAVMYYLLSQDANYHNGLPAFLYSSDNNLRITKQEPVDAPETDISIIGEMPTDDVIQRVQHMINMKLCDCLFTHHGNSDL